jgi:hypothetical protein
MVRTPFILIGIALIATVAGCGGTGAVKEEQIEVKASNDPLFQPRMVLQRYADGQPMSSEVTSFPSMVADVRKADPARADILEQGLADIQKAAPAARPSVAKEVLKKLQPAMK